MYVVFSINTYYFVFCRSIKEFDVIIQKIVIARHTLQGLVLGSGVNWADDPYLLQVVLKLGETLDFK